MSEGRKASPILMDAPEAMPPQEFVGICLIQGAASPELLHITSALASLTSSMANKNARPSNIASFLRSLLCASSYDECSKDEGSDCSVVKAAQVKKAWTQKSDHGREWSNAVLNQKCTSGDGRNKCPTSSSLASGKTQRHHESFVNLPRPSGLSDLNGPADISMSFSFGGTRNLKDEPSSHAKSMHAYQEASMHSSEGRHRTPPREHCLRPLSNSNCSYLPTRSSSSVMRHSTNSMGHAMVEASQASSNRFASPSGRCRMSIESALSLPVSPRPSWHRTSSLTPRLQKS
eukprot:gene29043-32245_t